jgi:hypothetical protein
MRGLRLHLGSLLIVSAVLGCAPAPSPTPSITAPPLPADVVPWPDVTWSMSEGVDGGEGGSDAQVAAVTAGPGGFVAVGWWDDGPDRNGLIWFSDDGQSWSSVGGPGQLDSVGLVDVVESPAGYVALGVGALGGIDRPHAVFLASPDGRTWSRLGQVPGSADTYPEWLAGSHDGVLAAGSDAAGDPAVWSSPDGRSFERVTLELPAGLSVSDPQAVDGGYAALGGPGSPPSMLRSKDGTAWSATPIDGAADVFATRLVPGKWGWVVQGSWAPTCAGDASCPASAMAWWSGDGGAWGRLPSDGSPAATGGSIVVGAGMHGLLAIDGASAWSSPDGWAWRPLPEPGDGSMLVTDAVVVGDVIVAVGAVYGDDGSSRTAIAIAQ